MNLIKCGSGITTLFAGGLLTIAIGAGATLAWTVAKDCYPGEARSIRKEEWEVLIIVTMHARGRSSSGFQGESWFFQSGIFVAARLEEVFFTLPVKY